jgi:DNA-binding transcriptional LysR family regulator
MTTHTPALPRLVVQDVARRHGSRMRLAFAADELDAAFCLVAGEIPDDLAIERLSQEEAVAAFAPGRAPTARHVGVGELRQRAIVATRRGSAITTAVEKLFADADEPLRLALESGDPFLLRSLAARDFATAILPRSLTALEGPAIEVRSLHPAVHLPVALVWRRERHAPPAARTFIDFVRRETAPAG